MFYSTVQTFRPPFNILKGAWKLKRLIPYKCVVHSNYTCCSIEVATLSLLTSIRRNEDRKEREVGGVLSGRMQQNMFLGKREREKKGGH